MPKRENTSEVTARVQREGIDVRSFALGASIACILALGVALLAWPREPAKQNRIGDDSGTGARSSPIERLASEPERALAGAGDPTSVREPVGLAGLSASELRRVLSTATTRLDQMLADIASGRRSGH